MAQRFGGKYSPAGPASAGRPAAPRPSRAGARVNLLFVVPFVFAVTAFFQGPAGFVPDLAAFGLLIGAAWFTREGERAHEAYDARTVARRPALPRKGIAGVLTAIGIGTGAWAGDPWAAITLGLIGGALHFAAFGPDPMRDKGMEGVDRFQTDRVARAVEEAERHIKGMREAIARTRDRDLAARVDRFAETARTMFRTVESDPRDLTAARRYLSVYLQGARDATARFAELHERGANGPEARAEYAALLDDLDSRFAQRTEVLLGNDRTALEVEIEVLRDRLVRDAPRDTPKNTD